jgi:hypothetical protein
VVDLNARQQALRAAFERRARASGADPFDLAVIVADYYCGGCSAGYMRHGPADLAEVAGPFDDPPPAAPAAAILP